MVYYIAIRMQGDQGFSYGSVEADSYKEAVELYVKNQSKDSLVFITSVDPEYEYNIECDFALTNGVICADDIIITTHPMPQFEVYNELEEALERAKKIVSNTFKDE